MSGIEALRAQFKADYEKAGSKLTPTPFLIKALVDTLKKYPKSPAVLMQNHGPFTIGKDAEAAVKAAAMTEEVAHTMWAAKQLGDIIPISQEDIDSLNDRYTNVYGQH